MLIVVCTGFAFGDLKSVLPLKGSSRKEESFMSGLSMACIDITALLHESFPPRKMHYIHVIDVSYNCISCIKIFDFSYVGCEIMRNLFRRDD